MSPQDPTVSPTSSAPLNYYVRFALSDGSVVTVNEGQFFALEGSPSTSRIPSASAAHRAARAPARSPSILCSSPCRSTACSRPCSRRWRRGTAFQEVDVLGYSQGTNQLVTDDSFGLVFANGLSTDASGTTQVSLEYGSEEIQQSLSTTPVSVGWNQIQNTVGFDISQAAADPPPAAAPATLSPQDPTVSPTSSAPLNYYVRFTLSDGSVVTVDRVSSSRSRGSPSTIRIASASAAHRAARARPPSILCSSPCRSLACSRPCSRRWRREQLSKKSMCSAIARGATSLSRTTALAWSSLTV